MATLRSRAEIPAVMAEMTQEEKVRLLCGGTSHTTYAIPRLGIPSAHTLDGAPGISYSQFFSNLVSTRRLNGRPLGESLSGMSGWGIARRLLDHWDAPEGLAPDERALLEEFQREIAALAPGGQRSSSFPTGMLLGACWDPEPVRACGEAMGREAAAYGVDVLLGPNLNIHRDPRNGRLFEGFSEDPYLVSELAPAYVCGVQEAGPAACVKHFAANNQETGRRGVDEKIPERALREIYFPGFRACVARGAKAVMSAYNRINGEMCSASRWLLTGVLRDEWGFSGMVVSDWGAVRDRVAAIAAGNTLDMPGPQDPAPVLEALRSGRLRQEDLDRCVKDFLSTLLELPVMKGERPRGIDRAASRAAAVHAVEEGCVLLKNENGALPLPPGESVSLFGARCQRMIECGGGSAEVVTDQHGSLLDSLRALRGAENVLLDEFGGSRTAVAVLGVMGREGADRPDLQIPPEEAGPVARTLREAKRRGLRTVLLLNVCGPVELGELEPLADAILCVFIPGMAGGEGAARLLAGAVSPSGKLPLSWPRRLEDCPAFGNFPGSGGEVWYGEGIYVGYRWYDARKIAPRYPFGFGLSYTSFALGDLSGAPEWDVEAGDYTLSVMLRNTGARGGKEVVQLYIEPESAQIDRPVRELKAFCKAFVPAGGETSVSLRLSPESLAYWSPALRRWAVEPGWYRLWVGTSSRDLPCSLRVRVFAPDPYAYGEGTSLGALQEDPRAAQALREAAARCGLDAQEVEDLLKETMQFRPESALRAVWETVLAPAAPDREAAGSAYRELLARLAGIDRVARGGPERGEKDAGTPDC